MCMYVYMCVYIHTYKYIYIYIYTHIFAGPMTTAINPFFNLPFFPFPLSLPRAVLAPKAGASWLSCGSSMGVAAF